MRRFYLNFAFIILILLACTPEENNLPTSTPKNTQTQTPSPVTPTDTPTSSPTKTAIPIMNPEN